MTERRLPRPIAAVDIGSSSIHLTVARIHGGYQGASPRVEIMATLKDPARLAAHILPDGSLSDEGVARAVTTLLRFRRVADEHGAEIRACATAALRGARNGADALSRINDAAGLDIQIISGADEARLVYRGVLHGLPELRDRRILCVDVGGGSTELLVGQSGQIGCVASVPVGAVVVTRELLAREPLRSRHLKDAQRRLDARLDAACATIGGLGFEVAVGTGGSIQRAVRVAKARDTGDMRGEINGVALPAARLCGVIDDLVRADTRQARLRIPGMDPERADTLLGGALIFEAVTRRLGIPAWTVSTAALRLGLLMDTWHRRGGP